jgi:hypothetical protein
MPEATVSGKSMTNLQQSTDRNKILSTEERQLQSSAGRGWLIIIRRKKMLSQTKKNAFTLSKVSFIMYEKKLPHPGSSEHSSHIKE